MGCGATTSDAGLVGDRVRVALSRRVLLGRLKTGAGGSGGAGSDVAVDSMAVRPASVTPRVCEGADKGPAAAGWLRPKPFCRYLLEFSR